MTELPALIEARGASTDLAGWLGSNRAAVDDLARSVGAVLLRGFAVDGAADFRAALDALSDDVLEYGERSSPRTEISAGVYTSTDYPADQHIHLHNEQSYTRRWPMRIVFCCEREPDRGGRTPLADSRRVLARLASETVRAFERRGVRYVRNYLPGIGLSWQEAFRTDSRQAVLEYCRRNDITAEWRQPDHLRTTQVRPAVRIHPATGERTWFNHLLFFHASSLPSDVRSELMSVLTPDELPYHTYYGDGSEIEAARIAEIRSALEAERTTFTWRRGDVLVVENMITAHGREPFEGPRRILTAMLDAATDSSRLVAT